MSLKEFLRKYYKRINKSRNGKSLSGLSIKNEVNVEHWDEVLNVGDCLSAPIIEWMLGKKNIDIHTQVGSTRHLLAVGSLIGMGEFDATIWGSGVHCKASCELINNQSSYRKYDIRAVRGPITGAVLREAGYECPKVYGDPAILMPLIYEPKQEKKYSVSIIRHWTSVEKEQCSQYHYIDVRTSDYKAFIDEIAASEMVVSSSLHGIILSEAYGVPAIFVNEGMDNELMKYEDWYKSTNRNNMLICGSFEEAISSDVHMDIPNLDVMRQQLMDSFPYDLWK